MKNEMMKLCRILVAAVQLSILSVWLPAQSVPEAPKAPAVPDTFSFMKKLKIPGFGTQSAELQERYDSLPDMTVSLCMLHVRKAADVPEKTALEFENEVKKQMVLTGYFKPVSLDKWLAVKYGKIKADSVFSFVEDLASERYPINMGGICEPSLFKSGKRYVVNIKIYPFSQKGYPLEAVRIVESRGKIRSMVTGCLSDLKQLYDGRTWYGKKTRIAVAPFEIDCKKLIEQHSGEFEFIKTSFSEEEGVTIKETDDYFSHICSYIFNTTGIFSSVSLGGISDYVIPYAGGSGTSAEYLVKGKIQLTDKMNIYYIDLYNAETGKLIKRFSTVSTVFTLEEMWRIFSIMAQNICAYTCGSGNYAVLPEIRQKGRCFYIDGLFAGWERTGGLPMLKGRHIIRTGTYICADIVNNPENDMKKDNKDVFINMTDEKTWVFIGRQGEYVWNLLGK